MTDVRPEAPIRLVVSDIDGTLVTKGKVVTSRAHAAIAAMTEAGIGFAVASARPPAGLRRIIEAAGIVVPVGAVNGAAIIRPDLSVVESMLLPVEAVQRATIMLRRHGIDPWLFTESEWFLHDPYGAHVEHEAKTIGLQPTVVEEFDERHMAGTLKIVGSSHDHALLAEVEAAMQADLGPRASATRSQAYYLDVTNAAANKGQAVASLAHTMGIPLTQVMTIGDGYNDTPMFAVAGFSVAMGNAADPVKALAKAVTDTNENEGFAKAVERYVLGGAAPFAGEA